VTVLALRVAAVRGHGVGKDVWIATRATHRLGARDDHHAQVAVGHLPAPVRRLAADPDGRSQRQH